MKKRVNGIIFFQDKLIKKSYRKRGKVHRAQRIIINMASVKTSKFPLPKSNIIPKNEIKINIPYSLINIRENKVLLNSVLNPETNSDSPSEKSKGERFDSDIQSTIHINNNGKNDHNIDKFLCHKLNIKIFILSNL